MSLESYKKKRDFSKTPEPPGKTNSSHASIFVIQKHAASHLHYDFRLAINGVLKSWAVPKGPCLDPSIKRLAVEVEDHPLAYANFEGTIPKGEYGAGKVIVWDKGIWSSEENAESTLKKGTIKFHLTGHKLKGTWKLIRTKGSTTKPQWLLIKVADEYSKKLSEYDITLEEPDSILSKKKQKKFPPTNFQPELATASKVLPTDSSWIYETKYDGYRIITMAHHKKIQLISRNNKDWTDKFPLLITELKKMALNNTILDGEVVVQDNQSRSNFQLLQNYFNNKTSTHNLHYFVFDMPFYKGEDISQLTLIKRKEILSKEIFKKNQYHHIHYSEHLEGNPHDFLKLACERKLEGIMAKKKFSSYEQKRTENWLKLKCYHRQEFVVIGYTEPQGQRKFFGALLVAFYDKEKNLIYCGHVGTGFTSRSLKQLFDKLSALETNTMPIHKKPRDPLLRKIHWIKPEIVIEVEFAEWTDQAILRAPSFQGIREDKLPQQVSREILKVPTSLKPPSLEKKKKISHNDKISYKKTPISLSHADKVLYPEMNITKADLADYYQKVATRLLPYIKARPLSLLRCPENNHECFFQKHWTKGIPNSIKAVKINNKKLNTEYITICNLEGLITLAQISTLEIHPWLSKNKKLNYPDQIIFDLDPDENIPWKKVKDGVNIVRQALECLELESFIKLTGGKGAHIVIPIQPQMEFSEISKFCKTFAEKLAANFPKVFTSTIRKNMRAGKIFIDYLRNEQEATAIASFSPRRNEQASIAVPLSWEKFSKTKTSKVYSIKTIDKYFKDFPMDPWSDYFTIKQKLTNTHLKALMAL